MDTKKRLDALKLIFNYKIAITHLNITNFPIIRIRMAMLYSSKNLLTQFTKITFFFLDFSAHL